MKKIDYFISKYLENRPGFYAFIRPQEAILFQKYSQLIKKPVLDFGCGDGFFAQVVFGKEKIDVGLDLTNNKRVEKTKKNIIYKKITLYDGLKIPYKNNYFKTIISNCVLEHIPNLDLSLKEIYRVLKPGGYFLVTVMTDRWEDYIFAKKLMKKIQQHYHLYSIKKWRQIFKKIPFLIKKEVGYLSQVQAKYNQIFHFLSLPSLINYQIFGKWVIGKNLFWWPKITKTIKSMITLPVKNSQTAAIFFVLQKPLQLGDRRR